MRSRRRSPLPERLAASQQARVDRLRTRLADV
jgi:hypothetical protein